MAELYFGNILITGANRGIGLELTRQLSTADERNTIFAACRDPNSAQDLNELAKTHKNVKPMKLDVTKDEDIHQAVEALSSNGGVLNVLFNNAGSYTTGHTDLASQNRQLLNEHFDLNATSHLLMAQAFRELLAKGAAKSGRKSVIVNMGSDKGSITLCKKASFHYYCSKAALNMMTKCLANELEPENISVVAVHPGWLKTTMGGAGAELPITEGVSGVLKVVSQLKPEQNGRFIYTNGDFVPY